MPTENFPREQFAADVAKRLRDLERASVPPRGTDGPEPAPPPVYGLIATGADGAVTFAGALYRSEKHTNGSATGDETVSSSITAKRQTIDPPEAVKTSSAESKVVVPPERIHVTESRAEPGWV